jgi:UDP-N-acetylmuramoyl-tripeptide--D-alanyl-D-alanine ligase
MPLACWANKMQQDALWQPHELIAALGAPSKPLLQAVNGVSIDSRTLQAGDLFFAVQGENQDGHAYVHVAFEKGAAACVVLAERVAELSHYGAVFSVNDALEALRVLGRAARARTKAQIIGVTGSVGKTGTKEALRQVLAEQGRVHAAAASYNNHFGVPLTLARMPRDTEFGIFEIGMSAPFEILPLTAMVRPHVALITTVEAVHIEFFQSVTGIADAKGEIFCGQEAGGTAILNRDNLHFERLKAHALASRAGRVVSFGEHPNADIHLSALTLAPDHSAAAITLFGQAITCRIGTPGRHIAMNMLGVLAAVQAVGGDVYKAAQTLADVRPPSGRGERAMLHSPQGPFLLIDESYNANPSSMRAAVLNLQKAADQGQRKVVVLGDMLELGEAGPELHRALAADLIAAGVTRVFAAGPLMRHLFEALPFALQGGYAASSEELLALVQAGLLPHDIVMIKGSNGSRIWALVKQLKELST